MDICQSCAMPLMEEKQKGAEKDGTKSLDYCIYCYKDGKFTDEGITLEEKINKIVEIASKRGFDKKQAKEYSEKMLPTLKRWKTS